MPSRRLGPDDKREPDQPAAARSKSPASAPEVAGPISQPAAPEAARLIPPDDSPGIAERGCPSAPPAPSEVAMVTSHVEVSAAVGASPLSSPASALPWPAPPPAPVAGAAGHLEDPEWVRALVGLAAGSDSNVELPLAWLLGATEAAAFVDTAGPMPAPFTLQESGIGWSVKKDLRLVEPVTPSDAIRATARAGLVTMWRDGQSRCLIDIVAARSVALEGPPVAVGYTLSDVVVELTTRRWSDVDEVYLVGFGREMHGLQGVRYLPTVADAAALVARDRPGRHGSRCFVVAPINVHHDREDDLRRLLRLVEQTPATGVICCDTTVRAHATWQLVAHRQTLRMEVRGRTGPSAVLTPDRWVERTGVRVRLAARSITEATFDVVAAREPRAGGIEVRGCPPVASGVDVLVLGPVQVNGAAESFEGRPVLTELVVYLAFHPEGLPGESFATTLWPERRVPQQTLSNRLHEARRALGKTQSDGPRLTRADGRHLLAPDVRTDWSRFVAFTGPASGPASWRQALALVRGRPFDGLAKGDWAVFEGFVGAIEAAAVSVAARLSQHLLGLGDPLGAESALRSGLLVAPWDERLYRLLMVAADAAGNRGGVESALRSLAQVLDCAGDPLEIVHPETAALYGRLTNDRRPTGSPGTH